MQLFRSKWLLIILIPAIGWLGSSFIKINLQDNIVNKEVVDLNKEISSLERNNSYLKDLIGRFSEYFIEREVRIKFNYIKYDEQVAIIFKDENGHVASVSEDISKISPDSPNYLKWWYWLVE